MSTFITFEANDGAGKTTQIRKLYDRLVSEGRDVILTREPGGSPGAEEIRALVLNGDADRWSATTELLLFMAARRDHVERVIQPALNRGTIVLCDRYVGSTLALQVAGGADRDRIIQAHNDFIGLWPDHTLYLTISHEEALRRAAARGEDESRMESKGSDYHRRVEAEFDRQAQEFGWLSVNGAGSMEAVHNAVYATLAPYL